MAAVPMRARSPLCQSPAEERASLWTHAVGLVLAVAAALTMLGAAWGHRRQLVAATIFGLTLVLLYAASTCYHATSCPRLKPRLQTLDHACIYLLIAGSYTPISLLALPEPWGPALLGLIWSLAALGVAMKARLPAGRESGWSTALYLAMGWLIVVAIRPLAASLPPAALAWLVGGGLFYTLGVIFFVWHRLPFHHAIWHGFVIAGSACHVVATTLYLLP